MRDRFEASSIADTLTNDPALSGVPRWEIAYHAALQGYLQGILTAGQIVGEMAADHEHGGDGAGAKALREAVVQIATVPEDRP